ncbi:hypothetical protein COP1_030787 [Malus domestica]
MWGFVARIAHGKLKAVMTPTIPNGFQSNNIITHINHFLDFSNSFSKYFFCFSMDTSFPRCCSFFLNVSPICRTISPLFGTGRVFNAFPHPRCFGPNDGQRRRATLCGLADVASAWNYHA